MAATELLAYQEAPQESATQTVAAGEVHTLIPKVKGSPGRVIVYIEDSAGDLHQVASLGNGAAGRGLWQVQGPVDYVVRTKNAGCDVDTGA